MLLVGGKRERTLREWIQLAGADVLDGVVRGASLFEVGRILSALLHPRKGPFVDTLDELVLGWHFGVLVQHFILGEQILLARMLRHHWPLVTLVEDLG